MRILSEGPEEETRLASLQRTLAPPRIFVHHRYMSWCGTHQRYESPRPLYAPDNRILFTFLYMSFQEDLPSRPLVNRGNSPPGFKCKLFESSASRHKIIVYCYVINYLP